MESTERNILIFMKNKYHEMLLTKEIQSRLNNCKVIALQSKIELLHQMKAEKIYALVVDVESNNQDDICNVHKIRLSNASIPLIAVVDVLDGFTEKLQEIGVTEVVLKNEMFYTTVTQLLKSILSKEIIDDLSVDENLTYNQSDCLKLTSGLIAHEINNPLMTILGLAELILDEPFKYDRNLVQKIKIIQKSALRIKKSTYRMTHLSSPVYKKTPYGVMIDPKKSRITTKSKVKLTETE